MQCSSGIQELPEDMGLPNLRRLDLQSCWSLKRLPRLGMTSLTSLTLLNLSK